eukprot:jgi/Hompol1/5388/HPOL_004377-RA
MLLRSPALHPSSATPSSGSAASASLSVKSVVTGASPKNPLADPSLLSESQASGPIENPDFLKATVWFDNIFPFTYGPYDPRRIFVQRYADRFIRDESWRRLLPSSFPPGAEFQFRSAEPNLKEGGLYLKYRYKGGTIDEAVEAIQNHIEAEGIRSIFNLKRVNAFDVKGRPWIEDMVSRVPSRRLHVEFIGEDLNVEQLYRVFRYFGRIMDITPQPSTSKETPRYASVEFVSKRSATSARNCIHGEIIDGVMVQIGYEKKTSGFSFWNWAMANLRLSVPIFVAIAAISTYLIFDPWREFSITNKLTNRFNLEKYAESAGELWTWTLSSFLNTVFGTKEPLVKRTAVPRSLFGWAEREKEEKRLELQFKQVPDTLVLVSGPKGSGKSDLIRKALENHKCKLIINCADLMAQSEHKMLSRFAQQVNFFPSFGFMTQITTFVDALITATTGAKAGLSTTNEGEMRKILECLTKAIADITHTQRDRRDSRIKDMARQGHGEVDLASATTTGSVMDIEYPVIVVDEFLVKDNSREHFLNKMLLEWAAVVATQHRIAHVVFVSDNPAAIREIEKVIPTRSVETFLLQDASPESALQYVHRRLPKTSIPELKPALDVLGGRLYDLDMLIQKIKAGQTPQ